MKKSFCTLSMQQRPEINTQSAVNVDFNWEDVKSASVLLLSAASSARFYISNFTKPVDKIALVAE
jgi:hypothetical protein